MGTFGFEILQALVTDIDPAPRVKDAMNEINAAQRLRLVIVKQAVNVVCVLFVGHTLRALGVNSIFDSACYLALDSVQLNVLRTQALARPPSSNAVDHQLQLASSRHPRTSCPTCLLASTACKVAQYTIHTTYGSNQPMGRTSAAATAADCCLYAISYTSGKQLLSALRVRRSLE